MLVPAVVCLSKPNGTFLCTLFEYSESAPFPVALGCCELASCDGGRVQLLSLIM